MHLHVTGLMVLDPTDAPEGFDFERFQRLLRARIGQLDALNKRVVPIPFGIDHPLVVSHDVDLSDHLRRVVLPGRPGSKKSMRALQKLLGEFSSTHLDRSRPLWEMLFIEGLPEGRFAMVAKLHHAMVDGVSGVDFMADLLDLEADAPLERPADEPDVGAHLDREGAAERDDEDLTDTPPGTGTGQTPEPARSNSALMWGALTNRMLDPLRSVRAIARTGTSLYGAAGALASGRGAGADQAAPFTAPHTPLNGSLTPRRSVAFDSVPLQRLKAIRRHHGVTLNDVLLAACASALRGHLERTSEVPSRPLVAAVPVSVHDRGSEQAGRSTNQVSNMFVHLPVNIEDPVQRLMAVHRSSMGAKAIQGTLGAEMLGDLVDLVPPPMLSAATSAFVGARIAEHMPPTHSVIISNVPGPDFPLYLAGSEIVGMYPFGPLMEGSGLNITVLSHNGRLDVGLIACPDLVPGLDDLLEGILAGFEELEAAEPLPQGD